ncbi:hypothetical protein GCK72_004824 [Caenorhabditis remanei]|uniref:C6 domain-containing protein n=1 Tax=Caenorhabditis remanei TaxID=31234 RepID=A0A6A5HEU5_CAERE|nr:hypothetical protein GCK72_004824 [Caenorhabditis remanei]KAF1764873.1 hypothetical protein GCK72_004824 [Caenorhabditis remanei]
MLLTTILVVVGLRVGGAENWKMENCPVTSKPVTEKPITEEPITEQPITEEPVTEEPAKCCPYPLRPGVTVNVTGPSFKCDEPIAMECQITNDFGGLVNKIGIAGSSDGYTNTILTVSEEKFLEKTVICSPSSAMWHLEGVPEDKFSGFTCAYMFSNGTWLYQ